MTALHLPMIMSSIPAPNIAVIITLQQQIAGIAQKLTNIDISLRKDIRNERIGIWHLAQNVIILEKVVSNQKVLIDELFDLIARRRTDINNVNQEVDNLK